MIPSWLQCMAQTTSTNINQAAHNGERRTANIPGGGGSTALSIRKTRAAFVAATPTAPAPLAAAGRATSASSNYEEPSMHELHRWVDNLLGYGFVANLPFFFCSPNQITMGYRRGLCTDTMILKDGQKEGEWPLTRDGGEYLQKICRW